MIDPRRSTAICALFLVSGCSMFTNSDRIVPGGYVVADEPQAAEAGAAILAHGGNAADAVTATYLALSVTYPVAAGLGGGGVCVVHAGQQNTTFDFEPAEARTGGIYAIPGNVSGFSRLQAIYGRLPWQRVVSPAESFAGVGFRITRALETRLSDSANVVRLDATLSAEFLNESGQIKPVGSRITARALAQTLSEIRTEGPDVLYRGALAHDIVSYSAAQGGAIAAADLEAYAPVRSSAQLARVAGTDAYLASSSTVGGRYIRAVLSHLVDAQGQTEARGRELTPQVFSAAKNAYLANNAAPLPPDLGETGFAAVDGGGMAVACGVTMNGPFGSGHTVPSTGVTLANSPDAGPAGLSDMFLLPLIDVSDGQISLAGAGAGGPDGSAAMLVALLQVANGESSIAPGFLQPTGREPQETVNVIGCRNGLCAAEADPRGFGLGAGGS